MGNPPQVGKGSPLPYLTPKISATPAQL